MAGSVGFVGLWKTVGFVASEGVLGLVVEFGGAMAVSDGLGVGSGMGLPRFPYTSWVSANSAE